MVAPSTSPFLSPLSLVGWVGSVKSHQAGGMLSMQSSQFGKEGLELGLGIGPACLSWERIHLMEKMKEDI